MSSSIRIHDAGNDSENPINSTDIISEDFFIAATVEGHLVALNRTTGKELWVLGNSPPLLSSIPSTPPWPFWVIEPLEEGTLYYFDLDGLHRLPSSIAHLVESSPFAFSSDSSVFIGKKETTMVALDALTGKVIHSYGHAQSRFQDSIYAPHFHQDCPPNPPSIIIGRTDYLLTIHSGAKVVWESSYSIWHPNTRAVQNKPLDARYISPLHDGTLICQSSPAHLDWVVHLNSPVVAIFDVLAPTLHQNYMLAKHQSAPINPNHNAVYVNRTRDGSWYALSANHFPLIKANIARWYLYQSVGTSLGDLIGVHYLGEKVKRVKGLIEPANSNRAALLQKKESKELISTGTNKDLAGPIFPGLLSDVFPDVIPVAAPSRIRDLIVHPDVYQEQKSSQPNSHSIDTIQPPSQADELLSFQDFPVSLVTFFFAALLLLRYITRRSADDPSKLIKRVRILTEESDSPEPVTEESRPPTRDVEDDKRTADESDGVVEKLGKKRRRGGRGKRKAKEEKDEKEKRKLERKGIVNTAEFDSDPNPKGSELLPLIQTVDTFPIRINSLEITDEILGRGSQGTVVYRGSFEGRAVAVKRMLVDFYDIASHEVSLLQKSDDHPNVIRYFCKEQSERFLYMALQLCPASLADVVDRPAIFPDLVSLMKPIEVLYQMMNGLKHLHSLKIVHRDIKPENILVSGPFGTAKCPKEYVRILISDFGLCKKLEADQSSWYATTANAAGTSGWRAPELLVDKTDDTAQKEHSNSSNSEWTIIDPLSQRRVSRAIDIFSMGCVFYWFLTNGHHPFGDRYLREANIVRNQPSLAFLSNNTSEEIEATDLIRQMIHYKPKSRPDTTAVMNHPFFWPPHKRLNFLLDVSDRLQLEQRDPPSQLLQAIESKALEVVGTDWYKKLHDRSFVADLVKRRTYQGDKVEDLLRAIRNKKNHYQELPAHVKQVVGPLPDGFLEYFTSRWGRLLLHTYNIVRQSDLTTESAFRTYFPIYKV